MSQSTRSPITRFTALLITSCIGSLLLPHRATAYAPSLVNPEYADRTPYVADLSFQAPRRLNLPYWRFGTFDRRCFISESIDSEVLRQAFVTVTPRLQEEGAAAMGRWDLSLEYTVSAHPTVFVHVPSLSEATAMLSLQNEDATEELYSTEFELTGEEGVIGIKIPESSTPLAVEEKYVWQMLVTGDCATGDSRFRLHISGWIERIAPTESLADIGQVPLRDRPALYAEAGIWQDTLSSLGSLMLQYPDDPDVRESWVSLMESADLPEFAQAPLLYIHTDE